MPVTCTFQGRRKTSSPQKNQNRNQAGLGRNEADSITSLPPTDWKSSTCSKGAFYFEGDSLISHQYNLELQQRQRVQISIQVRIQSMDLVLVKQLINNFYVYVLQAFFLTFWKKKLKPEKTQRPKKLNNF